MSFSIMHADFLSSLAFAVSLSIAVILTLRAVTTRRFGQLIGGWACLALHPSWCMGNGGDCGTSRWFASAMMTAAAIAISVGLNWFRPFGPLHPALRALAAAGLGLGVFVVGVGLAWPMTRADAGFQECIERSEPPSFLMPPAGLRLPATAVSSSLRRAAVR